MASKEEFGFEIVEIKVTDLYGSGNFYTVLNCGSCNGSGLYTNGQNLNPGEAYICGDCNGKGFIPGPSLKCFFTKRKKLKDIKKVKLPDRSALAVGNPIEIFPKKEVSIKEFEARGIKAFGKERN
jgi:hypothetical protein